MSQAAAVQLDGELGALAARVGAVLGTDVQLAITARGQDRAGWLVADLAGGDTADEVAADLLALLWPDDPPLDWWATPLGLLVAPTAAMEDGPGWSRAEAAAVLGVSAGTVAQLAARGTLGQAADGGLDRRSVLARLVRLAEQRTSTQDATP